MVRTDPGCPELGLPRPPRVRSRPVAPVQQRPEDRPGGALPLWRPGLWVSPRLPPAPGSFFTGRHWWPPSIRPLPVRSAQRRQSRDFQRSTKGVPQGSDRQCSPCAPPVPSPWDGERRLPVPRPGSPHLRTVLLSRQAHAASTPGAAPGLSDSLPEVVPLPQARGGISANIGSLIREAHRGGSRVSP